MEEGYIFIVIIVAEHIVFRLSLKSYGSRSIYGVEFARCSPFPYGLPHFSPTHSRVAYLLFSRTACLPRF